MRVQIVEVRQVLATFERTVVQVVVPYLASFTTTVSILSSIQRNRGPMLKTTKKWYYPRPPSTLTQHTNAVSDTEVVL